MLTTRRLDIADARCVLEGAGRRAEEIGVPMCTAVVDHAGVLVAFERLDGGKVSSVDIAIDKAYTAAAARKETAFYGDDTEPNSPAWRIHGTNGGRFSTIGGGVPVIVDGEVVGGIGVSSGTATQDVDVAEAALAHFHAHQGAGARR
ncbi:MAG TPA: heme-binding protein [Acidimicrobiales bacterium]|nr:heme-binding protein [Acidimicrobiales bacterium]